ncbi:MAG: hypothetical protein V4617_04605 [Gemmatimonadota bacterium]
MLTRFRAARAQVRRKRADVLVGGLRLVWRIFVVHGMLERAGVVVQ